MLRLIKKLSRKQRSDVQLEKGLKALLGFSPKNISLYRQAFLHSSKKESTSNERLEFLGDAVLGAVVAEHLFKLFPYKDEGFLTLLRSKIVNGQSLHHLALKFGIDKYLKANLNQAEKLKSSAYGDAFEALIGAIYLDRGFSVTKKFIVTRMIKVHVDIEDLLVTNEDYKSQLQIYTQRHKLSLEYKLLSEAQRGKDKIFTVQVVVGGKPYVTFEHYSKRVAEQKAAQLTLEKLK